MTFLAGYLATGILQGFIDGKRGWIGPQDGLVSG